MHPILFEIPKMLGIGPIEIRWYGVMVAVAFIVALHLGVWRGKKRGLNPDVLFDLGIWLLVGALIGARVLYVLAEWRQYAETPWEALFFFKGGLVFYGGVLGAIPVGLWFIRRKGLPTWLVADLAAPSLALGHALGRVGCFLNGCCFGHPTECPMGVVFAPGSAAWEYFSATVGRGDIRVHPVQLYEAVGEVVICIVLLALEKKKRFHGQLFSGWLLLYGGLRFGLEELREGNPEIMLGLTGSQWISVAAFLSSFLLLIFLKKGSDPKEPSSLEKAK